MAGEKRKVEMRDEKSKRALVFRLWRMSSLAVGMHGNHSDEETDDGEYQDLSI